MIPVGLWGTHRLHAKNHWPRWRTGLVMAAAIGAGIAVLPEEDDRAATDRIMDTIAGQVATARLLYGQRPPPGDDAWWTRHRRTNAKRMSVERG